MSDQQQSNGSSESRSTADNIRELSEASKQLFEAGKQVTKNLSQLSQKVDRATSMGSDIIKSPWVIAGTAVVAGLLVLVFSRKRS